MTVRPQSAVPFLGLLAIPLVAMLLIRSDLNQAPGLDAYVYAAYVHDYIDLINRYGRTYYSTRLGHILPNAAVVALLGDRLGYYVTRYLLLVAATASIYRISRHYARPPAAWFNTIFFSTHVWLLNEVFWDHYDSSVVILSLVGIALLLPRRRELPWHFFAGFTIAWAANGHPISLVIAAAYGPAWLLDRLGKPPLAIGSSILAAMIGFVVGYGALLFAMTTLYPSGRWRFDEVTVDMLQYMFSGGAENWFSNLSRIFLTHRWYEALIFPFFVVLSLIGLLASIHQSQEMRRQAVGAAAFILTITGFFAVFHFVLHWGLLSLHYYIIYALPACMITTAALMGQFPLTPNNKVIAAATGVFFVLHFAFWLFAYTLFTAKDLHFFPPAYPWSPSEYGRLFLLVTWPSIAVAFIAAVSLAFVAIKRQVAPFFWILFLMALLSSNAFFLQDRFARLYGDDSRRQLEWDVRDGALYLQRFVAAHVPPQAPIRFWYGTRDRHLNSVQSSHLWEFSRLSPSRAASDQMPTIDKVVKERLALARYVAILGNDAEIEAARAALENAGVKTDSIARSSFKGKDWPGYDVLLLDILRN